MHVFKLLIQEKSTQDEKVHFIKRNELKVTQTELLTFFKCDFLNLVTILSIFLYVDKMEVVAPSLTNAL